MYFREFLNLFRAGRVGQGKEKSPSKKGQPKRGQGGRGVWGEFRLARAEAKPRRPARSEQSPAKKFSFPFKRKNRRAQNKKLRRKLFCGTASEASGGGAERQSSQSGFSSKKVRILTKRHRQFSECDFWAIVASPRQRRGSASARILNGFLKSQNNFCPLKRKFGLPKANINLKNLLTNLFSFAFGEGKAII